MKYVYQQQYSKYINNSQIQQAAYHLQASI